MKKKFVKENGPIEFSELYLIILKQSPTQRQEEIKDAKKQDELYKTLNPRYSENLFQLKEAKLKVDSSDIIYSSKYNILTSY